uniref:Uncharacterized protein n=1 Tax=Setaria viridis TaxID=4556 RepID=A0A4U6VBD6_SETVI|nr:hypothetical protein SEVIR_3G094850v2 [Setaria viridis]
MGRLIPLLCCLRSGGLVIVLLHHLDIDCEL